MIFTLRHSAFLIFRASNSWTSLLQLVRGVRTINRQRRRRSSDDGATPFLGAMAKYMSIYEETWVQYKINKHLG